MDTGFPDQTRVYLAKSWAQLSIDKPWAHVSSDPPQVIPGSTLDYPRLIPKLSLNQYWTIRGWSMTYSWAISGTPRDHSWVNLEPSLDHLRVIHWVISETTLESCRIITEPYLNQPWPSQDYPRFIHKPPLYACSPRIILELCLNKLWSIPGPSLSYP